MSDTGILEACLDEIVATIQSTDEGGVAEVVKSQGPRELLQRDAERLPAIGVAYRGFEREQGSQGSRIVFALTRWEVTVLVRNEGGQANALMEVIPFVTTVRDRLHRKKSSKDPMSCYIVQSEQIEDLEGDLVACVATYTLRLTLGH